MRVEDVPDDWVEIIRAYIENEAFDPETEDDAYREIRGMLAAVAPLIAAKERGRCAARGDAVATQYRAEAVRALDAGDMLYAERLALREAGAKETAATIRAMGDGP